MKKIVFLIGIALSLTGCTRQWNDLVHKEVVAYIKAFGVAGQVSCNVLSYDRKVDILLPYYADPAALKLTSFEITEGATCSPSLREGDVIDLSEPLTITLSTYDDYVWTVTATLKPTPSDDLYNMSFDLWTTESYGDAPYGDGAGADDKALWGSSNYFLGFFGRPVLFRETEFVARSGEGKAALKLLTQPMPELSTVAEGFIFTGAFTTFDFAAPVISCGVPFIKRPKAIEGFACYKPQGADKGFLFVALADWDAPYEATPLFKLVDDVASIPGIIGYGKHVFDGEMSAYEDIIVEIEYKNDHTPKYVVVMASSSYNAPEGGSILYLDELGFIY